MNGPSPMVEFTGAFMTMEATEPVKITERRWAKLVQFFQDLCMALGLIFIGSAALIWLYCN